jgi:ferric-dicitrate binding protein FerR (iron transport regulator)
VTKELLDRFFRKECTQEEAEEVAAYFKVNPSALEEYLSVEEWNAITSDDTAPDDNLWKESWQSIRRSNRNRDIVRKVKRVAAAASIIVLITATVYYALFNKSNKTNTVAVTKAKVDRIPEQQYRTVRNDTKRIMRIVLDDNSTVALSPASFIQYDTPFAKAKRDVLLEGEAKFTVTKNKAKPFTVHTGSFTTTDLGTVFTVKHSATAKTFTVHLFEGKVVVHSVNKNLNGWRRDVYLVPGQQLEFNMLSGTLAIHKAATIKPLIAIESKKRTVDSAGGRLNFNNASLPEVMHTLAHWYNINIQYDSAMISKMNFTGLVLRNDSPEIILRVIAEANGLDVSKNENVFTIYKP